MKICGVMAMACFLFWSFSFTHFCFTSKLLSDILDEALRKPFDLIRGKFQPRSSGKSIQTYFFKKNFQFQRLELV